MTLIDVPVAFLSGSRYPRELNQYLRELAVGNWHPSKLPASIDGAFGRETSLLSFDTLEQYARRILNFLEWTEAAGIDWRACTYMQHLVKGYQSAMQKGRWAVHRKPLQPSTINGRVSAASNFQRWAAERNLRGPYSEKRRAVARRHHDHAGSAHMRLGYVRQAPAALRLPTAAETSTWLNRVRARFGATKALMCELVIRTAVRRREAVEWSRAYMPTAPAQGKLVGDFVMVHLTEGTKYSKPRDIRVELDFAAHLYRYQTVGNLKAKSKNSQDAGTHQRIFLSEDTGKPISSQVFYEAWTGVELPFQGWSPHAGRHYWACTTLLRHLELQTIRAGLLLKQMPDAWVHEVGRTAIQTIISPQLGHCDESTTLRYLTWLEQHMSVADAYLAYHTYLDGRQAEDTHNRS